MTERSESIRPPGARPAPAAAKRALAAVVPALALCGGAAAQDARGVNPADIDSRLDVVFKQVRLEPLGRLDVLTVKYDYKVNERLGLSAELPVVARLSGPGLRTTGNGDLFGRGRWIVPAGSWTVGAAVETVLPAASDDALGLGKVQVNFGAIAVKPLSRQVLMAGLVKHSSGFAGERERPDFSNTEVRLIPVLLLSDGWAVSGELRHTTEHRSGLHWQRVEASLNKQFDPTWAGSLSYARDSGDRPDRGTLTAAVKYFF